ncbi:7890_t:CDS:2 [Ambispora gerdemannii]|uniref:7890_t:CDS:1 n=1 Tax=Ambispora gerdemannii TaxID=144530 RepID=A0A9N9FKS2_9GLOM|nr:7890_t:CDS:2 [Ambispora gerdemannii]
MGSCVSLQNKEAGNSRSVNRFHDGISGKATTNTQQGTRPVYTRVVKRPKKKVHKGLIGLPSNFQHTGHIGITEMRSGKVDPEKIRSQMAEVAAALRLEVNRSVTERPESSTKSGPAADHRFKVKRKPTLTSVSHPPNTTQLPSLPSSDSYPSQDSIPTTQQKLDPMAEIVAALKMPSDTNFGLEPTNETSITVV